MTWPPGVVVTVIAASMAAAVLVTLRALGRRGRRPAGRRRSWCSRPAAVFMAVSADAVHRRGHRLGHRRLALAATRAGRRLVGLGGRSPGSSSGSRVMMSYGMPLMGVLAIAVLVAGRSWRPLPVAAVVAVGRRRWSSPGSGFAWWDAYPVLEERYFDGIAADRPLILLVVGQPRRAGRLRAGRCSVPDCASAAPIDREPVRRGGAAAGRRRRR